MDIVIIGTGNIATVLARRFQAAGHRITQIFGRNAASASALAYQFNTTSTSYWSVVRKDADLYLVAVTDSAIADVAEHLRLPGRVVAHTAAAVSKDVLRPVTAHFGVLYPLQSLRTDSLTSSMPIVIDAADAVARATLTSLAASVSDQPVSEAGDEERLKLHVAAVFVNNFTNHLFKLAEEYCRDEGLDFSKLIPLIMETADRLKRGMPSGQQTGPAVRHDQETIDRHLATLAKYPRLQNMYRVLTKSIQDDE
ncbi:MAG TPA: F420-dependent NADP oxidoreductase [Chitinophagaceae bacterium]|jgi:predicted short-subunit dehydrogenase-like oxidoreductase (DUF2520 family)